MSLTPKLDVLKRYKSNPKKKRKNNESTNEKGRLKVIVDSDVYLPTNSKLSSFISDIEEDIDEDAPLIAEIVDERAEHIRVTDDLFEKRKWKAIERPDGIESKIKFDLNFKSIKLNVGDRLSSNLFKAAKKASEYAKMLTASESRCTSNIHKPKNDNNVGKTYFPNDWRNMEAIPADNVNPSIEKDEANDDNTNNDSDLSPERPEESVRSELRSQRAGLTTVRKEQHIIDKEETKLERENQYKMWSKGLAQINDCEQRIKLLDAAKEEPFTRHKDDKELDQFLKDQERQGDPMANFLRSKNNEKLAASTAGEAASIRRKCKFPTTPNRFGIEAGYRWDGVDRSNGFECKLISVAAGKKSIAEHAYKWKVEDM